LRARFNQKNKQKQGVTMKDFPVWKTIRLGTGIMLGYFSEALAQSGLRMNPWYEWMLQDPAFKATTEPTEVDLVVVTEADLGLEKSILLTPADIYKQAIEVGLDLCPNEVGPQLRLQYRDQPQGEYLWIAMEPIIETRNNNQPLIFVVGRDIWHLLLDVKNVDPSTLRWSPRWVFIKPRK